MAESPDASGARRAAILEAATGVFLRYGFKKTSMDDLARAAGLSRQGLYLHFPTKEALFKQGVVHMIATARDLGRQALAREQDPIEERILGAFVALHGHTIGKPGTEHMTELMETAAQLVGAEIEEHEAAIVADLTRVLRSSGVASSWKDAGISARDLAEHLCATSFGVKHQATTPAAYRDRMSVAVHIVCGARR